MKIENITRGNGGQIDCMVEHPEFGMVPYTACPSEKHIEGYICQAVFKYLEDNGINYDDLPESQNVIYGRIFDARTWRNNELDRADVMYNRIVDGMKGKGTQADWRAYRNALRDYPEAEGFPSVESRPVAPDAA